MLIVTRGIPGSGKSTWSAQYVAQDLRTRAICSGDGLRNMMSGTDQAPFGYVEDEVEHLMSAMAEHLLERGKTVVVDEVHITRAQVAQWRELAERFEVPFRLIDFTHVPLEECLRRNAARNRQVPEQVIREMHAELLADSSKSALALAS